MGQRSYPDIPRIYVDMDGTIADFEKAAADNDMEPAHFKRVAGAFSQLEPIRGALSALPYLDTVGIQVFILTKIPAANPYAALEKLLWVRKHFPEFADRVIISPDKGAVGTPRDFLVDDHPEWANAHNFPGKIIKFEGDWISVCEDVIQDLQRRTA